MRKGVGILLAVLMLVGCTRGGTPLTTTTTAEDVPVAPIMASQVRDLLSTQGQKTERDDSSAFKRVDPDRCAGVAREVEPPFLTAPGPVATESRYWVNPPEGTQVVEIASVFHADFDAKKVIADAAKTIDSCQSSTLTIYWANTSRDFRLQPRTDSGSPNIVVWSFSAYNWNCDDTLVAAHNAAIEITACSGRGGFDVLALARDALKRIEGLANSVA